MCVRACVCLCVCSFASSGCTCLVRRLPWKHITASSQQEWPLLLTSPHTSGESKGQRSKVTCNDLIHVQVATVPVLKVGPHHVCLTLFLSVCKAV